MAVPFLSYFDIVRMVEEVSRTHNANAACPVDVESIIDVGYGINIFPRSGLMDLFQIDAFISRDLTEIVVDKRIYDQRPPNRYRFSLAHEFAHLILHPDTYRRMTFTTPEEWKAVMGSISATDYQWLEWQANNFAGLLLVPPARLRDEVFRLQRTLRDGGLNPDQLDNQGIDRMLRLLAQIFAVSMQVIDRRLRKDELWNLLQR